MLATKYPIRFVAEVFDDHLDRIEVQEDSIDSARLAAFKAPGDSIGRLRYAWLGLTGTGDTAQAGCYRLRLTVNALRPVTGKDDYPKDTGAKLVMEWDFSFGRVKTY